MNETAVGEAAAPVTTQAMTRFTGVQQTKFSDRAAAKGDQTPVYKAKKGIIDRIAILDPNIMDVGRAHGHFVEGQKGQGLGYVLCKSTYKREGDFEVPENVALCCQQLPEARKRLATFIIRYSVDPKSGMPTKPLDFTLLAWVFSPEKFTDLDTLAQQGYDLGATDLIVNCEDDNYQKIKFFPAKECVRAMPEFKSRYGAQLDSFVAAMRPKLARVIGRDVTDQEILEKAGNGRDSQAVGAGRRVEPMQVPDDVAGLFS
jgi:hypothetical protein